MTSNQQVTCNQAPPLCRYQSSDIPKEYIPIGVSYESALQTLLADELVVLPKDTPYRPQVKPKWWNDKKICAHHLNRGCLINNYFSLKGAIQKLINDGTIKVNNLSNNEDHTTFKNPFMSHEKGESSRANQKSPPHDKVNHTHHYDNTIGMISKFDEIINVIIIQDKNKK